MKTLDSQSLHSGIDELLKKFSSQMDQANELENMIRDFSNLNDSLKGKGGTAIRSFYQDWHIPILSFYYYTLKNYERVLISLKEASIQLESDQTGLIRQSFLDGELTTGLKKANDVTTKLVDDSNSSINSVNDIVTVQNLNDQQFQTHFQRANKRINETIEDLGTFDTNQTKALDTVEQDIQLMNNYISEIQGMFNNGTFNMQGYQVNQLKDHPAYSELKDEVSTRDGMSIGHMLTSPFSYINEKMSFGDNVLAGYQFLSAATTIFFSNKLTVNYFRSKPTLWQKLKGDYKFSVKADPSWTSRGKHSSKIAKWLLDFSRSSPTNPIMNSLQKFVASYTSPSHLLKHVAGFPKNSSLLTGKELVTGTIDRMKTGTKELVEKAASAKGLTSVAKRVPLVGSAISVISNLGEFSNPANSEKSISEKTGRFAFGLGADLVAIGAGAQIGATIGSIGGPVGVVVGGAVGGLIGGIASSTFGDQIKDGGEKVGKIAGELVSDIGDKLEDIGGSIKSSVTSWFN